MNQIKVEYKHVDTLKNYEKNPRNNKKAIDKVKESIATFGFRNPIIIDNKNVIVAGHTRLQAAKELNITEVPCIVLQDLTPEKIKAFRIADNKTSEYAEWDMELLYEELQELADMNVDLSITGMSNKELEEIMDDNTEVI
jgi:ParB-like chromosome segregation protein Spo0J